MIRSVLVAGASGYIGANLCRQLTEQGISVIGWGRRAIDFIDPISTNTFSYNKGDVMEDGVLDKIAGSSPEAVVYCVSLDQAESEREIEKALEVNVTPLWKLVERLSRADHPVRFIYLSTMHIYGQLKGNISETSRPQPQNRYGLTHLMAEEVMKHYGRRSKLDPLIIRLSNGYGPPVGESTSCWPLVLNDLCKQAIELGEIHLLSDGTPQRDFIYIDDAVMAISKLLKLSGHRESEIFNIGGGRTYSIMELALEVSRINRDRIGREVPVILKDGNILTTADKSIRQEMDFTYDITAARESGITPQINLEEGINRLFDYLGESMQ